MWTLSDAEVGGFKASSSQRRKITPPKRGRPVTFVTTCTPLIQDNLSFFEHLASEKGSLKRKDSMNSRNNKDKILVSNVSCVCLANKNISGFIGTTIDELIFVTKMCGFDTNSNVKAEAHWSF